MKNKEEFCIMKNDPLWRNYRFMGSHKHHIYGGAYRKKSEEDGLVIFLTPQMHNMSNNGIHFNKAFMLYAKAEGQRRYMEYYNKTTEDFIARYGHDYIAERKLQYGEQKEDSY